MYKFIQQCRACGDPAVKLVPVFDLGVQPLANSFRTKDEEQSGYAPLKVLFCEKCSLAQLSVVVDPVILYQHYTYETSKSATMRLHFQNLWDCIRAHGPHESVIEIGSNDGDFLMHASRNGAASVLGIDASENFSRVARLRGINTLFGILDDYTADMASRAIPKADVVLARHVFCHADDWQKFMRNIDTMANRETLIVIEVPYAGDTIKRGEFDQIYHEHLSYLGFKAMTALLEPTPFRIHSVRRFSVHGGVVAFFIRRRDFGGEPFPDSVAIAESENITVDDWCRLAVHARQEIDALRGRVAALPGSAVVGGYGASAKSTVWLNACGFSKRQVRFVTDTTPSKIGRLIPGTEIPVLAESAIKSEHPDCMICFAWNYKREIIEKEAEYLSNGGQFIFPHEP